MEINELLPIGTIVRLDGGEKKVMIFGVKQTDEADGDTTEYDYIGVMYPEGNVGNEYQFLFNHENVAEIFFRGYEDGERDNFIKLLGEAYARQ